MPERINWESVDWTLSGVEIAKQLGCSQESVSRNRPVEYKKRRSPKRSEKIDWSAVDWSLSGVEIAKQLGCSPALVSKNRPAQLKRKIARAVDWGAVDWSRPNEEIARDLGCSKCIVSLRRPKELAILNRYPEWDNVDWSRTNGEIADLLGVQKNTVSLHRPNKRKLTKIDWSSVDWSMPNEEIAKRYGCSYVAVYKNRPDNIPQEHPSSRPRYDWDSVDWALPNIEIAKQLGCAKSAVSLRRPKEFALRNRYSGWDSVDWSLSDKEIADILKCPIATIYRRRRKQAGRTVAQEALPKDVRVQLVSGPYSPPAVKRGDHLFDEIRGDVAVGGYTDALIPWPRVLKTGVHSLVFCGDLVRAVKTESVLALCHWFGVNYSVVWRWRKHLGVARADPEGTKRLYKEYKPLKLTDFATAKGRKNAATPESLAKMSETLRGRTMPEKTRAALLEAVRKPKTHEWKIKHSESMFRQWRDGTRKTFWTEERLSAVRSMLEKGMTPKEMAQELGTSVSSVWYATMKVSGTKWMKRSSGEAPAQTQAENEKGLDAQNQSAQKRL